MRDIEGFFLGETESEAGSEIFFTFYSYSACPLFFPSGFGSIAPGYFCWKGGKELMDLIKEVFTCWSRNLSF